MHTSIWLLALSGFVSAAPAGLPWQSDYQAAKRLGAEVNKPLAVFLGSGTNGWKQLAREGGLSATARKILSDSYVCVHIDTATDKGKAWAGAFEMSGGLGIVLSDLGGKNQAYRHEGDLADANLVESLQRYADGSYVARASEGDSDTGARLYTAPPVQFGQSYCPT
jgi:hypothetical protein